MTCDRLQQDFWDYHRANPEVYRLFKRYASIMRAAGYKKYSARAIIHRIRWEIDIQTEPGEDGFKINNNHSPYYARLMVRDQPEFAGFFEMRCDIELHNDAGDGPPPATLSVCGSLPGAPDGSGGTLFSLF